MGACLSKDKCSTKKPTVYTEITELKKAISDSGVQQDFDIIVSIDCSLSHNSIDGASLHDIPPSFPKISKHLVENQFIYALDILNEFLDKDSIPTINLFFFGTKKANDSASKLEEVTYRYDYFDNSKNIIDTNTNLCTSMVELTNAYVGGKLMTEPSNYSSFASSIDQAIKTVRRTHRYTILYMISDCKLDTENQEKFFDKLKEASKYPISIVLVNVGDSVPMPVKCSEDECNNINNITYVSLRKIIRRPILSRGIRDDTFIKIFNNIPCQYNTIKKTLQYKPKPVNKLKSPIKRVTMRDSISDSIVFVDISKNKIVHRFHNVKL